MTQNPSSNSLAKDKPMTITIFSLDSLLKNFDEPFVEKLLHSFKGFPIPDGAHDVEVFLHQNAINFERSATATTYLVFDEETKILLGFFSLANKPLTLDKETFDSLSNTQKKKLMQSGRELGSGKYQVNSYLIGQLGKNYSTDALKIGFTGDELLTLAYNKISEASKIIKAKYVWLECDDHPNLLNFYHRFGFKEVGDYVSDNHLCIMIMKIS